MERCYTCNHCGKCTDNNEMLVPVCKACGHKVQPGESNDKCAVCGSTEITFPSIGPGAPIK